VAPVRAHPTQHPFGQHLPLNRQSQRFKCEGIELSVSTLADQVGASVFALMPLYRLIETHVLAAERLHGDGQG
jgi:transposase